MHELFLDPVPAAALESLRAVNPRVAEGVEEYLDWIEADPPDVRAKRRRFTNGMWAIVREIDGSAWVVLWDEEVPSEPTVRHIGETASL